MSYLKKGCSREEEAGEELGARPAGLLGGDGGGGGEGGEDARQRLPPQPQRPLQLHPACNAPDSQPGSTLVRARKMGTQIRRISTCVLCDPIRQLKQVPFVEGREGGGGELGGEDGEDAMGSGR